MVYCNSVVVILPVTAFRVVLPSAVTVFPVKEEWETKEDDKTFLSIE